jgi:hypothetical protein
MAVYPYKGINEFRKGQRRSRNNYYEDPTYLTFMLQFMYEDDINSPLLADADSDTPRVGTAAYYLKNYIKDEDRAYYLKEFVKTLRLVNSQLPWFWQSLAGVDTFINYNVDEPYRGGDDAKLTITCLESLNLMMAGMMDLYRAAMWDEERWVWVVPDNLRKFTMIVYVSEMRKIQETTANGSISAAIQTAFSVNSDNQNIVGENLPFFAFKVSKCEFELNSGNVFAELSAFEPKMASSIIEIKYSKIHTYDAKYLNGILGVRLDLQDRASAGFTGPFADQMQQFSDTVTGLGDSLSGFAESAVARGAGEVQNMVNGLLANVFLGNAHGGLRTFGDALRQGSINAVANNLGNTFGDRRPRT